MMVGLGLVLLLVGFFFTKQSIFALANLCFPVGKSSLNYPQIGVFFVSYIFSEVRLLSAFLQILRNCISLDGNEFSFVLWQQEN